MKRWQETAELVERAARLLAEDGDAALATVVRIEGSAYRRPGAKLLVAKDGRLWGGVSGGCLEADVRERALEAVETGESRVVPYHTGPDDPWGLGLGCDGSIDVFVQPLQASGAALLIGPLLGLLRGEDAVGLVTVIGGDNDVGNTALVEPRDSRGEVQHDALSELGADFVDRGEIGLAEIEGRSVFIETLSPPPRLLVCGAGDDAVPLVRYATDAGFRVVVADHRERLLSRERFPRAWTLKETRPEDEQGPGGLGSPDLAVIMTHSLQLDEAWLRLLLGGPMRYVGVLGPRERTQRMLQEVSLEGAPHVFGPVGLDLAAEGAEQVSLSIVAEILAVVGGREPAHLRGRSGPIHG
jgi:xanthine/CO dehydrogenase XdhC/CoxF family maturation factor